MTSAADPVPPAADAGAPTGWDGLFDADERILWQGCPGRGLGPRLIRPLQIAIGVVFMPFSLFWMAMARRITAGFGADAGPLALFPLFGWVFFAVGAWNAGRYAVWNAFVRGRTTVALSTRRAFVATDLPLAGRRLRPWRIDAHTRLGRDGSEPGTIRFDGAHAATGDTASPGRIGFERLVDARAVHAMLRRVARGEP